MDAFTFARCEPDPDLRVYALEPNSIFDGRFLMVRYIVRDVAHKRLQRSAIAAIALFALGTGSLAAQDPPIKIGVMNLDLVALQSPSGKLLQEETIAFQENVTLELQNRQEEARAIESEVAAAGDSLSADAARELERRYQDALTGLQRFQQDKQEEAAALRADGMSRIQREIAPVIEKIQAELGYDLVFNSQNALIVIFSERVDITQLVIDRLAADSAPSP